MKVRISIPGMYMAMEMEEEQARVTFRKMAELLWVFGNKSQTHPEKPTARNEKEPEKPVSIIPSAPESESEMEATEVPKEDGEEQAPKIISPGYGGYLYMKCPVCGKIKGFCAKTRLLNYRCECGAVTRMEHMAPLYMKCECGRQARYMTNITEAEFDMTCYDCGSPVAMQWNEKKEQYEAMR